MARIIGGKENKVFPDKDRDRFKTALEEGRSIEFQLKHIPHNEYDILTATRKVIENELGVVRYIRTLDANWTTKETTIQVSIQAHEPYEMQPKRTIRITPPID